MRQRALTALLLGVVLTTVLLPAVARADFGLREFDVSFSDKNGNNQALAGSHPYQMQVDLAANLDPALLPKEFPEDAVKDLEVSQVPGFIGDLTVVPRCSTIDFLTNGINNSTGCSNSTVSGIAAVEVSQIGGTLDRQFSPLYNLEPAPGSVARFGFFSQGVPVVFSASPDEKPPYVVIAHTRNVSQVLEFNNAQVFLWGTPADPSHDPLRGTCLGQLGESLGNCTAGLAPRPFITLPRSCTGPLASRYAADSWQNPGSYLPNGNPNLSDPRWVQGFALTHDDAVPPNPQGMVGCSGLGFAPVAVAKPTTTSAESASGLSFTVDVEDEGLKDEDGRAQADIDAIRLVLPAGVTANPSAAEGLGVCSAAQFAAEELDSAPGAGCPGASKLGTLEAETPILESHPLHGSLYLASQQDNPFGSLLALYLVVRDQDLGVFVKLAAKVEPDPATGQLVTTTENMPPFPLSHVEVKMRSGPRAPLVTPPTCGTYSTIATLYPSSGKAPLKSTSSFTINSGPGGGPCPVNLPFSPGFEAGAISNAAGTYSPFSMRITRKDGEQDITRFQAKLPPGVVAKIAGVGICPDAAIDAAKTRTGREELASPSCPSASQIGTLLGGAGVGADLTYVPGSLYLAGPYNGARLSVVAIVPAVAGPFDVGTVVTRVALALDPETGEGEVDASASDPIPHMLKGIPLKVRDLRVFVDRPNFALNATNCNPFTTRADIFGGGSNPFTPADDAPVAGSSPYQASSCASLGFKPNVKIQLKGQTKIGGHPKFHSVVTYPKGSGYANIGRAVVILPHSEFIDPERVALPCTRPQFAEGKCPPASRLGYAKAWTPLLDEPLQGPVYFRANGGVRDLPDIVADLNGQFHVVLLGAIDSVVPANNPEASRLRSTFAQPPDAPVSRFELDLKGGKEGVLENSANLCAQKRYVEVKLTGQNGLRHNFKTPLQVKCPKGKQGSAKHRPTVRVP